MSERMNYITNLTLIVMDSVIKYVKDVNAVIFYLSSVKFKVKFNWNYLIISSVNSYII